MCTWEPLKVLLKSNNNHKKITPRKEGKEENKKIQFSLFFVFEF